MWLFIAILTNIVDHVKSICSANAPLNPPVLYPVGLERWLAALFLFSDLGLNLEDIRGLGAGIP
jgi:hypothetical protein